MPHDRRAATAALRARGLSAVLAASFTVWGLLAHAATAAAATPYTSYVANWAAGTVTPINTATSTPGTPIAVGANPAGIAITPDGRTAYVANSGTNSVTPINTATNTTGTPIAVGFGPAAIAITPDGRTAYVTNYYSNSVTPINTATNTAGAAIAVGSGPVGIAITPDGRTVYVANNGSNSVTPINTAANTPGTAIAVGFGPLAIAITPDGRTAYVANNGSNSVTPINTATNTPGTAIAAGSAPAGVAITPDGASAYVANSGFDTVTPITVATNTVGTPITVGNEPWGIAITPDGSSAYVTTLGHVAFSGNSTFGSTTVSGIGSTARLRQGMTVTGTGIPAGTTIAAPPGPSSITLSQAATASGTAVALTASEATTVTPVSLAAQAANAGINVATSVDPMPAITPDQAPVASFAVTVGTAGTATSFDASSSVVAYGTITSYAWSFGDGATATTATPLVTHTYATSGTYTATLTETDSAGTSTTQVFTGQTVSRNGGPGARTTRAVIVASAPAPLAAPVPPAAGLVARQAPLTPVAISRGAITVNRHGEALIVVRCPATALGGCRGRITLQFAEPRRRRAHSARCARGCRKLGSAEYEARAGQSTTVRVHIASFARGALARRHSERVTVIAQTFAAGQTVTSVSTITLRAFGRRA